MKLIKIYLTIIALVLSSVASSTARELGGIEWDEFKNRSELIFSGLLIKAEFVPRKLISSKLIKKSPHERELHYSPSEYYFTYRVDKVFKGDADIKEISFRASPDESIMIKTVGGTAIVALRKEKLGWVLSVDERSCWTLECERTEDLEGLIFVYKIPTHSIYNLPTIFKKKVRVKRLYEEGSRIEECVVFPAIEIDLHLEEYLKLERTSSPTLLGQRPL